MRTTAFLSVAFLLLSCSDGVPSMPEGMQAQIPNVRSVYLYVAGDCAEVVNAQFGPDGNDSTIITNWTTDTFTVRTNSWHKLPLRLRTRYWASVYYKSAGSTVRLLHGLRPMSDDTTIVVHCP